MKLPQNISFPQKKFMKGWLWIHCYYNKNRKTNIDIHIIGFECTLLDRKMTIDNTYTNNVKCLFN